MLFDPDTPPPAMQRARGHARVGFRLKEGRTRLADLYQEGSAKVRLPRVHDGGGPVAVFLNTAGGVTGGDRLRFEAGWEAGAVATVTTQAAERVYRRSAGVGEVGVTLRVGAGAVAEWLPQETIVFDAAGFSRRTEIEMAADARLLAVEWTVLGRAAMGETVRRGDIREGWRLRREGLLVFADAVRLAGDPTAILGGPATGGGAAAYATLILAAPDAEARLGDARDALAANNEGGIEGGASAFDGLLVVRLIAPAGRPLRDGLVRLIETLRGRSMPRVWSS